MNVLEHVIGTQEAAQLWNVTPKQVIQLCQEKKVRAKQISKVWVIDARQPYPNTTGLYKKLVCRKKSYDLTLDKVYVAVEEDAGFYAIITDDGLKTWYAKSEDRDDWYGNYFHEKISIGKLDMD